MHSLLRRSTTPFIGLAAAMALAAGTAQAQSPADFYKGHQINIVVGSTPGGGYDQYSRLLARHMPNHIAGAPVVIVRNMPGAGSLTSVLYLDATAPKDGTFMTAFNSGLFNDSMAAGKDAKAKFTDYAFLGSATQDFRVCYAAKETKIQSFDDLAKRKEVVFGGTGPNSNSYNGAAMLKNIFGLPMKIIAAYPGNGELLLAVERGELDGSCLTFSSIPENWIRDNKINFLLRLADSSAPTIPDGVPFIRDVAKTEEQKDIIDVLLAPNELGRPYIMSRSVPKDRVAYMQDKFMETLKDQALLDDAAKQGLTVDPVGGVEAEKTVAKLYTFSPDIIAKAQDALK
ncbi:MAG TPA: hypothetical protein VGO34_02845 [Alphaproteobacteria bacterium]|jgi:tripartite-type tricarboxylate transporter receptor subunit TctC